MGTIPREFRNAFLLAVTPAKRCVGIKIFNQPDVSDSNGNLDGNFDNYIGRCIRNAAELKELVEAGVHSIENDERIVKHIKDDHCVDAENLWELRSIRMQQLSVLKHENRFIDLGRSLVDSVRIGHFNFKVCTMCINEISAMIMNKKLTALMLKKNPEIVNWIAKLCRFNNEKSHSRNSQSISSECQMIRTDSSKLLKSFERLMNYDGSNDGFMYYFYENVKLFHELTTNISNDEKRQLTKDPEDNLLMSIS